MGQLQVGDIFCTPLPLGYWGAVRVFSGPWGTKATGISFSAYCTKYVGRSRPELTDPLLLKAARAVDQVDRSRHSIVGSVHKPPGKPFEYLGNIPVPESETKQLVIRGFGLAWDQAPSGVREWLYKKDRPEYHRFEAACDELERALEATRSRWSARARKSRAMTEQEFWSLIEGANPVQGVQKLVGVLAEKSADAIVEFGEWLAYKLYCIDGEKYALQAGPAGESDDAFLYARCFVVACGAELYESVRKSPRRFPQDADLEELLEVVPTAYRLRTGEELELRFAHDYETGSNDRGWP